MSDEDTDGEPDRNTTLPSVVLRHESPMTDMEYREALEEEMEARLEEKEYTMAHVSEAKYPVSEPNYGIGAGADYGSGAEPKDESGAEPKDGIMAGSEYGSGAVLEDESGAEPNYGSGAEPNYEIGAGADYGSAAEPKDGSGAEPKDGSGAEPKDGSETVPKDGSGAGSEYENAAKSEDGSGAELEHGSEAELKESGYGEQALVNCPEHSPVQDFEMTAAYQELENFATQESAKSSASNITQKYAPSSFGILHKNETVITNNERLSAIERRILTSASTSHKIGPRGGELELFDCMIKIPAQALEREVDFEMSVINNPAEFPPGRLSVAPVLQIKPSIVFKTPITMKIQTCCADDDALDVLYQKKGQIPSWELLKEVKVQDGGIIQFQVQHFCRFNPVLHFFGSFWPRTPRLFIFNDLYINRVTGEIDSVFFTNEKVKNDIKEEMKENGYEKAFPLTERFTYKYDDHWNLEVTCVKPVGYNISSYNKTIAFNGDLQKSRFHHLASFNLDRIPGRDENELQMIYKITESGDGEQNTIFDRMIQKKWPIPTESQGNQQLVKIVGGNVGTDGVSGSKCENPTSPGAEGKPYLNVTVVNNNSSIKDESKTVGHNVNQGGGSFTSNSHGNTNNTSSGN